MFYNISNTIVVIFYDLCNFVALYAAYDLLDSERIDYISMTPFTITTMTIICILGCLICESTAITYLYKLIQSSDQVEKSQVLQAPGINLLSSFF